MIVVDASVAVRWVASEEGSELAATLLTADNLHAPDLIAIEVGSELSRKVAAEQLTRIQADAGLQLLFDRLRLHPSSTALLGRAVDLSLALKHPIYDCIYVALAEHLDAEIATQDAALAKHIRRIGTVPLAAGFR